MSTRESRNDTQKKWRYIATALAVATAVIIAIITLITALPGNRCELPIPDNRSRVVVLEFKIDAKPVRGFDFRPGYYVYRSETYPALERPNEEVYRFYVNKTEEGYVVKKVAEFYSHKINATVYNATEIYKIVNDALYFVNWTLNNLGNGTIYPIITYYSGAVLATPPIYPYLHENANFKVRLVQNITYMPPLFREYSVVTEWEDSVRVRGVEDCRGPSGRCYVVEISHTEHSSDNRCAIRVEYVLWVDLAGPVVKVERYEPRIFGKELVSKTELVEWK